MRIPKSELIFIVVLVTLTVFVTAYAYAKFQADQWAPGPVDNNCENIIVRGNEIEYKVRRI